MSFSVLDIILLPVILMTVIFLVYFVVREMRLACGTGFKRLLSGAIISGVGTGLFLSGMAAMVLPDYVFIDEGKPEGQKKRYVLNSDFFSECGSSYLLNRTSETFYIVAKSYGDAKLDDYEPAVSPLPPGRHVLGKDIDDWFVPFPISLSSSNYGVVRRNVMRYEDVERELAKKVEFIHEEDNISD